MPSVPDHAKIYKKLHEQREAHVEQARRARDMQAELAEMRGKNFEDRIVALVKAIWGDEKSR